MKDFIALDIPEVILSSLERMQISSPTPVQAESIPLALEGHDLLASAQTGTGKTYAFGIPLLSKLLANGGETALVVTPTRELATQVHKSLMMLLPKKSPIKSALLIGGDSMHKQKQQLRHEPQLIVGTPGRIYDHIDRGTVDLGYTSFLVLDETDRMLDMGFSVQIDAILEHVPKERQTLLFSATLPKNIIRMSDKYLTDPKRVAIGSTFNPAEKVKQEFLELPNVKKYKQLLYQLRERDGSVVVFVKTKINADKLARKLRDDDVEAEAIHGDLRHAKRERVIKQYRNRKFRVLIATDVAARGLDIPHIELVINYDLPQCPEDYIHRIGRTARAEAEGYAVTFISPNDKQKWHAIDRMLNPDTAKRPQRDSGKQRRGGNRRGGGFAKKKRPGARGGKSKFFGKKDDNKSRVFGFKGGPKKKSAKRKTARPNKFKQRAAA